MVEEYQTENCFKKTFYRISNNPDMPLCHIEHDSRNSHREYTMNPNHSHRRRRQLISIATIPISHGSRAGGKKELIYM
jgi:hypothetical protein